MAIAAIALLGIFVALYLALYKAGVIGKLACSVGSCETVQLSRWATFLGLPVAVWGVGFYVAVLVLALTGLQEQFESSRGIATGLLVLNGWGLVFSAWLTWLELYVIHAICQYCVVSACLVAVMFVLSAWDWRATRGGPGLGSRVSGLE